MKHTFFWLAAAALVLVGCNNKPETPGGGTDTPGGSGEKTFTATLPALTKVSLDTDGLTLGWAKADKVSIFDGAGNQMFRAQASGASAPLLGTVAAADSYYALYPYDASASLNGSIIQTTVPAQQTATAGGADLPVLAVAKSAGDNLAFSVLSAVLQFTLDEDAVGVTSVKVKTAEGALAGAVSIDCGGRPALTVGSSASQVSVSAYEGTFKPGGTYYVAVTPGTVGAITVSYTVGDDEMEVEADGGTLTSGAIRTLPNLTRAMTAEEKAFLGTWTLLKYGSRVADGTVGVYTWVNTERGIPNPEACDGDSITFKSDGTVELNLGEASDTYNAQTYETQVIQLTGDETWTLVKEGEDSFIQFGGKAFPLILGDNNSIGGKFQVVHVTEVEMLLEIAYESDEGPAALGVYLQPKGKETYVHSFRLPDFGVPEGDILEGQPEPMEDNGVVWNVSVDADSPVFYMNPNAGLMMGRAWVAGQSARGATLWTESFTGKIASVTVTTARFAPEEGEEDKSAADVSVFVGGTKIGKSYSIVNDMTGYTFTANDPVTGKLEVKWETTNSEVNCYFLKAIEVIYEE